MKLSSVIVVVNYTVGVMVWGAIVPGVTTHLLSVLGNAES